MRRTFVAVGRIVGELREGRSLGADDLAAATGLAPSRVATIEAGEADPLSPAGVRPTAMGSRQCDDH